MTRPLRDVGASVRARLLELAQENREDFQRLLARFVNERLLHRLARSPHAAQFVLKGATLFTLWTGTPHRATRDLDFLGYGDPDPERVRALLRDVLAVEVPDDGVRFDAQSLEAGLIREEQEYGGVRVGLRARIAGAEIRLQFDVGFGDAITPEAQQATLPVLLDFPAPKLRAYPRETVVAEKLEAAVRLGLANSRMKDFFDLLVLARGFSFEGRTLARAIRATFERRGTAVPRALPVALTPEFSGDPRKQAQWSAFVERIEGSTGDRLDEVMGQLARFLSKPLVAAARAPEWRADWVAGGPWSE